MLNRRLPLHRLQGIGLFCGSLFGWRKLTPGTFLPLLFLTGGCGAWGCRGRWAGCFDRIIRPTTRVFFTPPRGNRFFLSEQTRERRRASPQGTGERKSVSHREVSHPPLSKDRIEGEVKSNLLSLLSSESSPPPAR